MVRACLWFVNMVLKLVDTDEEWLMVVNGSQSFMLVLDTRMCDQRWLAWKSWWLEAGKFISH